MAIDITPGLFEQYKRDSKLGQFVVDAPGDTVLRQSLDLKKLYESITLKKYYQKGADMDSIDSVVLFGETLFNNHKLTPKKHSLSYALPSRFDILVITNENLVDSEVIKSSRNTITTDHNSVERIIPSVVKKEFTKFYRSFMVWDSYTSSDSNDLYIAFRSKDQIIAGFENGDTMSADALYEGIPILGRENFYSFANSIKKKSPQFHKVEWSEDGDFDLRGNLLSNYAD